jgi:hypothetical protein
MVEVDNQSLYSTTPTAPRLPVDHYVVVTARNGIDRAVKAIGWGISIPGDRTVVVSDSAQPRPGRPPLPHWLQLGAAANWLVKAQQLRDQAAELDIPFEKMITYVRFADVRKINADRGVPLT